MPTMKTKLVLAGATIALLTMYTDMFNVSVSIASDLEISEKTLTLDAQDVRRLVAETGAGSLIIKGVEGSNTITLNAEIYSDDNSEIELTLVKQGDDAHLVANVEQSSTWSHGDSPHINVSLLLPAELTLTITDGSGSINIQAMAADVEIADGSGSIEVSGTKALTIKDGSGSIKVSNIDGKLSIKDGSGSIEVATVADDTDIVDGSGSITVDQVKGVVTIKDGSGSIKVNDTKGLTIRSAGSGSVDYTNIDGPVNL